VTESKAFSPLTTTVQVQANMGKVHKCLFHICYEEQNFNILQIQIQGLSSTFKHLSCFQALSRALIFFPKFKHFQGFLKHAMNPAFYAAT